VSAAASANARNKVYFTVSPEDATVLARHTMPELSEHDLSHLDAHTAAARLVVAGRETPAFTMLTRPAPPVLGETTALRAACDAATPPPPASALAEQARLSARRHNDRRRDRATYRTGSGRSESPVTRRS
jgi:hypothetical protein